MNVFLPDNDSVFSEDYCYGEEVEINIQPLSNLSYVWTMDNRWTEEMGDDTIISTTADLTIVPDSFWGILGTEVLTLTITDNNGCSAYVYATINLDYLDLECEVDGAGEDRLIVEGTVITLSENSGYTTYEWTNSNGDLLLHLDGTQSGIGTVGITTTGTTFHVAVSYTHLTLPTKA